MNADGRLALRHSPGFVGAWRSLFCDVYRWRQDGRFAVVPSLVGSPTFAYLPGLSYSDLEAADARQLARDLKGRKFNIRALSAPQAEEEPVPGTPVVLRIDLAAFNHDPDLIWRQGLNGASRTAVRRARKSNLIASEEAGSNALRAFRDMLRLAYLRHGMPMPPMALFEALAREMNARILVVRNQSGGGPWASLLSLRDGPVVWVPFSGGRRCSERPDNLLYWAMVEQAAREGADILDLGRSATGSGPYVFKKSFGAVPVPVLWLSDKPADLYRRHATAQRVWRLLPNRLTDGVGPKLHRYLAEF